MSPSLATSPTLTTARARAARDGWDPSWVRSEVDARAVLDAGCWFDEASARRVVNFFEGLLRHTDGEWAGKPFTLLPWQRDNLVRPVFGWKRSDGTRRYRRGGIWIPKKNGKSTLAAGIELYLLIADGEPGAEVYSAANDRAQAGIIFKHARRMVELSPHLLKRVGPKGIIPSTKTIYDKQSGSSFQALSADAPTKEGLNIHGLIVDEIHAMKSRLLWDTLIYGGASRRQPLILSISTAGIYDIGTIGWEQYSYAKSITDGTNDSDWSFFSLMYEAGAQDDWTSPKTWAIANPSYGQTVKVDALAEECREAQAEPRKQNAFRRYRLNQWVQQSTRWIDMAMWAMNDKHPVTRASLLSTLSYIGLDLGSVSDLTAAIMLCECPHEDDAWDVLARFWVPDASLSDPNNRNQGLYQQWVKAGLLETTPGTSTNYDFIEAAMMKDAQVFNVKAVAIDRLFQGQQVANHLTEEGLTVVAVGQGFLGQGPPMKELERRLRAGTVHHGNHPILNWMADNVEVKQDPAGNLKMVKPNNHNDPRKIDGMTALVNAMDCVAHRANEPEPAYQVMIYGGRK